MDFSDLMNIASNNQQSAVNKGKNKTSKDNASQVSSAAVKAFLARQQSEKAKQKEQEEAARRARIQARLQGKQLDKSKKSLEDVSNDEKKKKSVKNKNSPRPQDAASSSKSQAKHNFTERKKADEERKNAKSKEKEKKIPEERTNRVEEKKSVAKIKKPARPAMSFQELMDVAKQRADNPDAFRNVTAVPEPKTGSRKMIEEKSSSTDRTMKNGREKEVKIQEKNKQVAGKTIREKNPASQKKQNIETRERKLPEARDRKQPDGRGRKQTDIRDRQTTDERRLPTNRDRKIPGDRKMPRNSEGDVKRKISEKPRIMTIERETISQKEYGLPMKHRGSNFQRKRRHNPYDDDDDEDMDEFIDDSEETPETVSNYIKEIFGYDRNKFRDQDEDIGSMESSFADIQREEAKSLRIAKLEDEVEKLKESYELQRRERKTKKLKH